MKALFSLTYDHLHHIIELMVARTSAPAGVTLTARGQVTVIEGEAQNVMLVIGEVAAHGENGLIDCGLVSVRSQDDPEPPLEVRAYLHPTRAQGCVSTDPTAYAGGRALVELEAVEDRIDWLERGNAEWRETALAGYELANAVSALLYTSMPVLARMAQIGDRVANHAVGLGAMIERQCGELGNRPMVRKEVVRSYCGPVTVFTKLTDQMPDPEQYPRVIIYTEGTDFAGEQFFDVKAEDLNENAFEDVGGQPEVCRAATHWAPRPLNAG